jgi:hypothetical protein
MFAPLSGRQSNTQELIVIDRFQRCTDVMPKPLLARIQGEPNQSAGSESEPVGENYPTLSDPAVRSRTCAQESEAASPGPLQERSLR